ncbi:MAG: hypothetical protein KA436_08860 [Oligoflexales bacterium]|nr:hypothetical protein [Oligoflexales bacterium]
MDLPKHTFLVFLLFYPCKNLFAENSGEKNPREDCRKRVAGLYLEAYDQLTQAKDWLVLLNKQKLDLTSEEAAAQGALVLAKHQETEDVYDDNLALKARTASERFKTVRSALKDQEDLISKAKDQEKKAFSEEALLRTRISRVFDFMEHPKESIGYRFEVRYKSSCPKYRYVCPLPAEAAQLLINIFNGKPTPPPCESYSRMR